MAMGTPNAAPPPAVVRQGAVSQAIRGPDLTAPSQRCGGGVGRRDQGAVPQESVPPTYAPIFAASAKDVLVERL